MTFSPSSAPPYRFARGFALLEALIGVVLLSFAVLGALGLQVKSLQAQRETRLQGEAVALARELAELMRGNKQVAAETSNNPYLVDLPADGVMPGAAVASCMRSGCANAQAVAQSDMAEWRKRVAVQLPGARVSVCFDAAPYDSATGLPQWTCSSTASYGIAYIKLGWMQRSLDSSRGDAAALVGADQRPQIVVPVSLERTL